jgi:endothelin-converting enzyme
VLDIVKAFKHSLGDLDWMDKESADAAAQKADKLDVKVGYPLSPDTRDARSVAVYYYLNKVDKDNYFENILTARCVSVSYALCEYLS